MPYSEGHVKDKDKDSVSLGRPRMTVWMYVISSSMQFDQNMSRKPHCGQPVGKLNVPGNSNLVITYICRIFCSGVPAGQRTRELVKE